jgi:hypothetical protein
MHIGAMRAAKTDHDIECERENSNIHFTFLY